MMEKMIQRARSTLPPEARTGTERCRSRHGHTRRRLGSWSLVRFVWVSLPAHVHVQHFRARQFLLLSALGKHLTCLLGSCRDPYRRQEGRHGQAITLHSGEGPPLRLRRHAAQPVVWRGQEVLRLRSGRGCCWRRGRSGGRQGTRRWVAEPPAARCHAMPPCFLLLPSRPIPAILHRALSTTIGAD